MASDTGYVLRKESLLIKKDKACFDVQGVIETTPENTKPLIHSSISHIVRNFPGIANWKSCDSRFLGCSDHLAKLANFNSAKEIIGKYDEDMPWGADGYAEVFREEDREVMREGTINFVLGKYSFAAGKKVVLTQKTPVINNEGYITSIINYITAIIDTPTIISITQTLLYAGIGMDTALINHIKNLFITKSDDLMFSPREEECLYFLIRGLTAKHIGKALGLSHRTIEFYITGLKSKLKCNKLSALVTKAIKLGYMDNIPTSILARKCT